MCGGKKRQEQNMRDNQVKKKTKELDLYIQWLGTQRYTLGKMTVNGKDLVLEVPDIVDLLCALAPYLIFCGNSVRLRAK